jgi:2'-5' RNA ligase
MKGAEADLVQNTIRAFIAAEIPQDIRDGIGEIRRKLKKTGADVRWVKPENMHLTLRFLGNDVPRGTVDAVGDTLHGRLKSVGQFTITLEGLGVFPNARRPRVVWLGIEPHDGPLLELREAVEDAVAEAGWTREERPFSAHLTLGRIKSQSGIGKLRQKLEKGSDRPVGSMVVDKVSLIQSDLKPAGPIYETLTTVILRPQE